MDCPYCGKELDDTIERCPYCGFNYNATLGCPYRISERCLHNNRECYIEGLNYESCSIYLHKTGIQ